jgi:hypothetical protein
VLEKLTPATAVAQGRLDDAPPVAVIDIGSNTGRLLVARRGSTAGVVALRTERTEPLFAAMEANPDHPYAAWAPATPFPDAAAGAGTREWRHDRV